MSETKKDPNEDIITSTQDAPEAIGDAALDDANGGWRWGATMSTNVVMSGGSTMLRTVISAETITASFGTGDTIDTVGALRERPAR